MFVNRTEIIDIKVNVSMQTGKMYLSYRGILPLNFAQKYAVSNCHEANGSWTYEFTRNEYIIFDMYEFHVNRKRKMVRRSCSSHPGGDFFESLQWKMVDSCNAEMGTSDGA